MNIVEINWNVITLFFIGLFVLVGFFRGWWKEALTTFFLGILIFLLNTPEIAQWLIDGLNNILALVWSWLPASAHEFLIAYFGITSFQIDAGSGQTWLVILILLLSLSIILSRLLLPNYVRDAKVYNTYVVTPLGSFLGGLLGGLNGFLIINLVKEYLSGGNLPTGTEQPATELAVAGGQTLGMASSGVGMEVTDLPGFLNINNVWGWLAVLLGLLLLIFVVRGRMTGVRSPRGYKRMDVNQKDKDEFKTVFVKE